MYKKIFINSIIIFVLSTLLHSLYNYLPNFITSIIVPVNESIWEHMKMIFSSYMLFLLIQILFYKKKPHNLISSFVITALFNIVIFLIIYLPLNAIIGKEIMSVTLIVYFISILISNYLLFKLQEKKENKTLNKIMGLSIILIYLIFTLLTYYPIKIDLFYDKQNHIYGIYKFYS